MPAQVTTPGPLPKAACSAITMSPTTCTRQGTQLRHHASNHIGNFRPPRSGSAHANALNLRRGNTGDRTRLTHSRVQSFPRPRLAQPDDVAPTRRRRAQHGLAIAHRAGCLRCPAVNAQIDRHALVLTQGSAPEGAVITTSLGVRRTGVYVGLLEWFLVARFCSRIAVMRVGLDCKLEAVSVSRLRSKNTTREAMLR